MRKAMHSVAEQAWMNLILSLILIRDQLVFHPWSGIFNDSTVCRSPPRRGWLQSYLSDGWAFSDRLAWIGATAMGDTSIRPWHDWRFGYGGEAVGVDSSRFATDTQRIGGR